MFFSVLMSISDLASALPWHTAIPCPCTPKKHDPLNTDLLNRKPAGPLQTDRLAF